MSNPTEERDSTAEKAEGAVAKLQALERFDAEATGIWVFGYGSLCWNQGFTFEKSLTGFIRGFSRKFWQGNTTHRGTQNKPGRVATLIEDKEGTVWGQAFQVVGNKAFSYLNSRECELGGYSTTVTTFYPRKDADEDVRMKPFPVVLYVATPSNRLWLGDSPLLEIAKQILECTGNSGHNVEYLLRLANFVRENIPEAVDEHLFTLEWLVRSQIKERKLCLEELMGDKRGEGEGEGVLGGGLESGGRSRAEGHQFSGNLKKTWRCRKGQEVQEIALLGTARILRTHRICSSEEKEFFFHHRDG